MQRASIRWAMQIVHVTSITRASKIAPHGTVAEYQPKQNRQHGSAAATFARRLGYGPAFT